MITMLVFIYVCIIIIILYFRKEQPNKFNILLKMLVYPIYISNIEPFVSHL